MHLDFEALIPASSATTGSQNYDPSAQPDATDEVGGSGRVRRMPFMSTTSGIFAAATTVGLVPPA